MSKANPHEVYQLYLGLKFHFTGKYDFFKYGPKKLTLTQFEIKKDKAFFYRLVSLYPKEEIQPFLISNFVAKPKLWIGEIVGNEGKEIFLEYQRVLGSFSYIFKKEIGSVFDRYGYLDCVKCNPHETPPLVESYYSKEISIQTMVAFHNETGIFNLFDRHMSEDPMWTRTRLLIEKYTPFFVYDRKKIAESLNDAVKSHK